VQQQSKAFDQRLRGELEAQRMSSEQEHAQRCERQRAEAQKQHLQQLDQQRVEFEQTVERHKTDLAKLQCRIQELEARAPAAEGTAEGARSSAQHQYEEQLERQQARIEMLQRTLQGYESSGVNASTADSAAGIAAGMDRLRASQPSPPGDAAAGLSREEAVNATNRHKTLGADHSAKNGPIDSTPSLLGFSSTMCSDLNTHMLSQLVASTYAPPVPPTTYYEPREDDDEDESGAPSNPELLVRISGCGDVMTNGSFAWVGVCNARPLYRLLGPEPRYLFYADADIASGWRVVNKMGSDEFVERFLHSARIEFPTACEKGEAGSCIEACKLTRDVIGRISMVGSLEERTAIRTKLCQEFGPSFLRLEAAQRGLASKTSPVVGIARALEAQQRAIQLLHTQLSAEAQRREAAETHASTMEEAFETLQLRIQAQLPGPPAMAALQKKPAAAAAAAGAAAAPVVTAAAAANGPAAAAVPPGFAAREASAVAQAASVAAAVAGPVATATTSAAVEESHDRALVVQQDGQTAWAPDLGPGQGPTPRPPVSPKEKKPVPPPTFRRLPSGLRNRLVVNGDDAPADDDAGGGALGDPAASSASLGNDGTLATPVGS